MSASPKNTKYLLYFIFFFWETTDERFVLFFLCDVALLELNGWYFVPLLEISSQISNQNGYDNWFDDKFITCYVAFPRKCSTTLVDYLCVPDLWLYRAHNDPPRLSAYKKTESSFQTTIALLLFHSCSLEDGNSTQLLDRNLSTVAPPTVSNKDSTNAPAPQELKAP